VPKKRATKGKRSAGKVGRSAATKGKGPGATAKADAYAFETDKPVKLLRGGNPQIAKADGDAPVQAYIAAMPGWKRDVGRRLGALIVRTVPGVRKAVRWNSPFCGVEGQGWFLNFHCFTNYVKVAFFRGTSLRPVPPGESKHDDVRYLDIHEDDLDEAQMATWIRQAAALPGWVPWRRQGSHEGVCRPTAGEYAAHEGGEERTGGMQGRAAVVTDGLQVCRGR
jgi:hypothetical protein